MSCHDNRRWDIQKAWVAWELSLDYRKLGLTNLDVSVIGFGASPLGNVFGSMDDDVVVSLVNKAIDSGINLFDVSPYYGLTLAEARLGNALIGRRNEVVLATKCGRYGKDHFDFSGATIVHEFESSLRRLRTDYVDLLQIHDVEFGTVEQIVNETVPALLRLQKQGKVRFIGITGYWPRMLKDIAKSVAIDTVLSYCHFNLLVRDINRELTPFINESGIGLLNASPLHMGLLGGGEVPNWHPAPQVVRAAASRMVEICLEFGAKPATVSLRFCLNHPSIASNFIGNRR
jgi:L-galactose dehydrogenase